MNISNVKIALDAYRKRRVDVREREMEKVSRVLWCVLCKIIYIKSRVEEDHRGLLHR